MSSWSCELDLTDAYSQHNFLTWYSIVTICDTYIERNNDIRYINTLTS